MSVRVFEVSPAQRATIGPMIRGLERGISYPLGRDRFEIDHGPDYFQFFDRLGASATFVAFDDDELVAAVSCVLRTVARSGGVVSEAWYGCDLKVAPAHRGRRLPLRLLMTALRTKYRRCRRGYGVAMCAADGNPAPVVRLASHIRVIGSTVGEELLIYTLDADQMSRYAPIVEAHRGPLGYLSLTGRKDLIMRSTGRAMPLMHVQFGPCAQREEQSPRAGHSHMFCAPATDGIVRALSDAGLGPSGRANVMHHGMNAWDWRFVLTSDL